MDQDSLIANRVCVLSPLAPDQTVSLLIFFAAMHDIGKLTLPFQWLMPELAAAAGLPLWDSPTHGPGRRHTELARWVWRRLCGDIATSCGLRHPNVLQPLADAAYGHHGEPIDATPPPPIGFDNGLRDAAHHFTDSMASLFLYGRLAEFSPVRIPPKQADDLDEESLRPLSWLAAGLFVLADWIGSKSTWFPAHPKADDPQVYWKIARRQAEAAVIEAGILPAAPSAGAGFHALLPHMDPATRPHPLQQATLDLPTPSGPELLILEDVTGGGKTEAAVLAAHRAMRARLASGLFVGLPTMATANAMYSRLATSYRALFADHEASLILAHGASALHDGYLRTIGLQSSGSRPIDNDDAEAVCAAWLADNRKKALLAPCGAGTLDQALLAALPSRHQSLRLLGLSRSVLIADEVHAYDEYTGRLLEILLTFHAALGGSAVLLSATMPQALRSRLVEAWQTGRELTREVRAAREDCDISHGDASLPIAQPTETAFPLLTRVTDDALIETPVAAARGLDVPVRLVDADATMLQALADAASAGACVCWVRNTVDDAMASRQRLIEEYGIPADRVDLFHARMAGCDRNAVEARVMTRFGKDSVPAERAGRILVATQVVEQSLDLDFDMLLSDLAPMELLIQRVGRCHRHARGADQANRPEGYRTPRLLVLSPDPKLDATATWYADLFPTGQYVYPRHGTLWLTAQLLRDKGRLRLPEDARELVEWAYTGEAPQALQEVDDRVLGESYAELAIAEDAGLHFSHGYCRGSGMQWDKDMKTPTRLGEATQHLRLMRCNEDGVRLWAAATQADVSPRTCHESELRLPLRKLATPDIPPEWTQAVDALRETMPDQARWTPLFPLVPDGEGGWVGSGVDEKGRRVAVRYSESEGLLYQQKE